MQTERRGQRCRQRDGGSDADRETVTLREGQASYDVARVEYKKWNKWRICSTDTASQRQKAILRLPGDKGVGGDLGTGLAHTHCCTYNRWLSRTHCTARGLCAVTCSGLFGNGSSDSGCTSVCDSFTLLYAWNCHTVNQLDSIKTC